MSKLLYATAEDVMALGLTGLPDDHGDELRLLRLASGAVTRATRRAHYDVTPAGAPKDEDVAEAFREATLAQFRVMVESGMAEELLTAGVASEPSLTSTSDNGASVSFDDSTGSRARGQLLAGELVEEARIILEAEGLLGGHPRVIRGPW